MRPLMATFLDRAVERAAQGSYDEGQAITVDRAGRPLVETGGVETLTRVVHEPADDHRAWSLGQTLTMAPKEPADDERVWALETQTKVPAEPADDDRVWALETATRVVKEPPDDDLIWAEAIETGLPPADDAAVGVVSF